MSFLVGDEKGTSTPDGNFRVYAGMRSDPFILAWLIPAGLKPFQNLLFNDNVLSIVVEFDTQRVLDPGKGSLFAVIAETVPIPRPGAFIGHEPPRIDWVGRPEQTNVRLNNTGLKGSDDVRDLWNQQTPFEIDEKVRPLFLQRMKDSLTEWDMRDGKQDWTPSALAANANMFVDDFLLIDVAKPTTDAGHLEIEKSTINGKPYQTGGGRTVDSNVIDVLLTWIVNRDRELLEGGTTKATKPGTKNFPYLAAPNLDVADGGGDRRCRRNARQGLGADRPIWRLLASSDRRNSFDWNWSRSIANDRNSRWQADHRTSRRDRQLRPVLSLHQYRRFAGGKLRRDALGQAEWCWQLRGMACSISSKRSGFACRENRWCLRCSRLDWTASSLVSEVTMTEAAVLDHECFQTTDGEIAIVNLNSARLRSWSRFYQDPQCPGAAETVLEHEQLTAQFASDLSALDRMEAFGEQLGQLDASSPRTMLIQAQIASALHRFSDARHYLAQASLGGAPSDRRQARSVERRSGVRHASGRGAGRAARDRREIRPV